MWRYIRSADYTNIYQMPTICKTVNHRDFAVNETYISLCPQGAHILLGGNRHLANKLLKSTVHSIVVLWRNIKKYIII